MTPKLFPYVSTIWHDPNPCQDQVSIPYEGELPILPYCVSDEQDADFPWLDSYDSVLDTQVDKE